MPTGRMSTPEDDVQRVVVAIAGAGALAHNVAAICGRAGLDLRFHIDEFAVGAVGGVPVHRAADLTTDLCEEIDVVFVAMSAPEHREAACRRLEAAGFATTAVFAVEADESLPALGLALVEGGVEAARFLASAECGSQFDLERHVFGADWDRAVAALDPERATVALCFYGRGGGFRSHLEWLIPRLRQNHQVLALADERTEGPTDEPTEGPIEGGTEGRSGRDQDGVPVLMMSPASASRFTAADLAVTAHFIPCSPPDHPRVSLLHTSFDFILEEEWLVDRLPTAHPHYLATSTRATHEWLIRLAGQVDHPSRVCLIPAGYPRLDAAVAKVATHSGDAAALLYAPTLSLNAVRDHQLTYSMPSAAAILRRLLADHPDRRVIFRPHPNDLRLVCDGRDDALAAPLRDALAVCEREDRCELDTASPHATTAHAEAALMISDTSSTAYTFALATLRPVVFFSPRDAEVRSREGETSAYIRDREHVGVIADSIDSLSLAVHRLLAERDSWRDRIADYRDETCFHLGQSEDEIVAAIDAILAGRSDPTWTWVEG